MGNSKERYTIEAIINIPGTYTRANEIMIYPLEQLPKGSPKGTKPQRIPGYQIALKVDHPVTLELQKLGFQYLKFSKGYWNQNGYWVKPQLRISKAANVSTSSPCRFLYEKGMNLSLDSKDRVRKIDNDLFNWELTNLGVKGIDY